MAEYTSTDSTNQLEICGSSPSEYNDPIDSLEEREVDVHSQLAQKEQDLILAAELGKALLESNKELQTRYDETCEEFTHKLEVSISRMLVL